MANEDSRLNRDMWQLARQMNQMMEEWMHAGFRGDAAGRWEPSVDVVECEREIRVVAELAGMRKEDINVTIEGRALSLSGHRALGPVDDQVQLHQMEITRGGFFRKLGLPFEPVADKVSATYEAGLLEIRIPKTTPDADRLDVADSAG